ncbi:MAG: hypothetical protein AAGE03_00400 [Pseudomonadota bacterium]
MRYRPLALATAALLALVSISPANAQGRVSVAEPDGIAVWGTSWRGAPGSIGTGLTGSVEGVSIAFGNGSFRD